MSEYGDGDHVIYGNTQFILRTIPNKRMYSLGKPYSSFVLKQVVHIFNCVFKNNIKQDTVDKTTIIYY